jgi:hypothetical protein
VDQVSLEVVRTGRRLSGFFSGVSGGRKERQEAWWILLVSGGRRNGRRLGGFFLSLEVEGIAGWIFSKRKMIFKSISRYKTIGETY